MSDKAPNTFEESWRAFCEHFNHDPDHTSEETFEYFRDSWIEARTRKRKNGKT